MASGKTLRLVARYADATHQTTSDPDLFRHKMGVLRRHCQDVGRDYEEIERYCGLDISPPATGGPGGLRNPDLLVERAERLAAVGSHGCFVVLPKLASSDSIERFGRGVIARMRDS